MPDELDLAVFHAVEISPRSSWAAIGAAVGVDPATAARRWESLKEANLAWVTSYPLLTRETHAAFVEITCRADCVRSVAAIVARSPHAMCVDIVSGTTDIFVLASAMNSQALSEFVLDRLPMIPGVGAVSSHPVVAIHVDSGFVAAGTLQRSSRDLLPSENRGTLIPSVAPIDDLDWDICVALGRDGRMSVAALSRETGASESTIKRRLSKLVADGALYLRARLAPSAAPKNAVVWLGIQVPPGDVGEAVRAIARLAGVTSVSMVAGPHNLLAKVALPHLAVLEALEAKIHHATPEARIATRMVVLQPVRQMSRVFDRDGDVIETVSVDFRAPID